MGPRFLLVTLALAVPVGMSGGGRAAAAGITPEERLATMFVGAAQNLLESENLGLGGIEMAMIFAEEAVALAPDDVELWRFVREVALLGENEKLQEEAVRRIVRLDPADDAMRLLRINAAIERHDRFEDRVVAYRRFLDPSHRAEIGDAVVSRLALDLALLQRRRGDLDAFADDLSLAVEIDPSNRAAAAIAAGFFRVNVNDPYAGAELLVNLMLADPTDVTSQIALAQLLLEQGAYVGAERLYSVAVRNEVRIRQRPPDDLLADFAISQWARGTPDAALRTIRERQQEVSEAWRARAWRDDPTLGPMERRGIRGPLSPTLATVRAAILRIRGDAASSGALEWAMESYEAAIAVAAGGEEAGDAEVARLRLEMASVMLWLGDDVKRARAYFDDANAFRPVSDTGLVRFDGLAALRTGDPAMAVELLGSIPDPDPATQVGLAEAHLEMGRRKEAARLLLAAARARPGSVVGIWAADRLLNLLGRRMSLSDEAHRLEDLIEGIGRSFDRYPESPSLALEFHLEPVSEVFEPYDPLILNLMITNRTPHPLAIDRDGPVRPQVVLFFSTTLARIRAGAIAPTVVSIDRRLRLEPHETLVVPVDLRRHRLGDVLSTRASRGTFVRVKGLINFVATQRGAIEPGLLGSSDWSDTIRIEGIRLSPFWLRGAVAALANPNDPGDMVTLALLGQVSAYQISEDAPPQLFQIVAVAREQIVRTFVQLDGPRMAWVLSTFPTEGLLDRIRIVAQRSDHRLVKMVYLMFHLTGPNDPLLDIARRSDDPHVRRLADQSSLLFEYVREINRRRRQKGGG